MEFFVKFTAYIDQRKRPENFPHSIHDMMTIRVDTVKQLEDWVNERCNMYTRNRGMATLVDPDSVEKMELSGSNRMWVPDHMWTHMTVEIKTVSGESPIIGEGGKLTSSDGKDVTIQ